jgi:DNA-binding MarR family transcriptional regulator
MSMNANLIGEDTKLNTSPSPIEIYDTFSWILYIGENFLVELEKLMKPYGLTLIQLRILRYLGTKEPVSHGELSNFVNRDVSTMTGILDRLEAKGLISRTINPTNRRQYMITINEDGQRLVSEINQQIRKSPFLLKLAEAPDVDWGKLGSALGRIGELLGGRIFGEVMISAAKE